jgi:chromosome segregation protein
MSDKIAGLDKEVYRLNAQKEKLTESISSLVSYMWSEYEMSLTDAKALRDDSFDDIGELKRSIAQVKDGIKKRDGNIIRLAQTIKED